MNKQNEVSELLVNKYLQSEYWSTSESSSKKIIHYKKPIKVNDNMISKLVNCNNMVIQLPKMILFNSLNESKGKLKLKFDSFDPEQKNSRERYTRLTKELFTKIDNYNIEYIAGKSEEWFNKKLTVENISSMYKPIIEEGDSTIEINYSFDEKFFDEKSFDEKSFDEKSFDEKSFDETNKLTDHKGNPLDYSLLEPNDYMECIVKIKFLVFSRESSYLIWELCKMKKCQKRIQRVKKYGFIEDPSTEDVPEYISDNETSLTFY